MKALVYKIADGHTVDDLTEEVCYGAVGNQGATVCKLACNIPPSLHTRQAYVPHILQPLHLLCALADAPNHQPVWWAEAQQHWQPSSYLGGSAWLLHSRFRHSLKGSFSKHREECLLSPGLPIPRAQDRYYLTDAYMREVLEHMSIAQLIDTILINPTVHIAPSYRDTGLSATYTFQPLSNLVYTRDQQARLTLSQYRTVRIRSQYRTVRIRAHPARCTCCVVGTAMCLPHAPSSCRIIWCAHTTSGHAHRHWVLLRGSMCALHIL